jgi:hypothetical protein
LPSTRSTERSPTLPVAVGAAISISSHKSASGPEEAGGAGIAAFLTAPRRGLHSRSERPFSESAIGIVNKGIGLFVPCHSFS